MSFIATDPASTPAAPAPAATVTNDGFFPDIDLAAMRAAMRLDGTVTDARLVDAVVTAMIGVNGELSAWQAAQLAAGAVALADIGPKINGEGVKLVLYRTAVYRTARADLTERYRDFDSTKSGAHEADQRETTIEDDRRAARWAIRDFLSLPRSTIELI